MTASAQNRVKKSYSISVESEQYVRQYRKAKKIGSDSEALDRLLQEAVAAEKMKALEAACKTYYDNASDEDMQEEAAWGEVGMRALSMIEWNG